MLLKKGVSYMDHELKDRENALHIFNKLREEAQRNGLQDINTQGK